MREFMLQAGEKPVASLLPFATKGDMIALDKNIILTNQRLLFEDMNFLSARSSCGLREIQDARVASVTAGGAALGILGLLFLLVSGAMIPTLILAGDFDTRDAGQFILLCVGVAVFGALGIAGLVLVGMGKNRRGFRVEFKLPRSDAFQAEWVVPKLPVIDDESRLKTLIDAIRGAKESTEKSANRVLSGG